MQREDRAFWDRLADMPWVEAEQECVGRREELCLQLGMLEGERNKPHKKGVLDDLKVEIHAVQGQLALLNERIKYLRKVQERVNWVDACKAILDHETYMQIKVWMEQKQAEVLADLPPPRVPH